MKKTILCLIVGFLLASAFWIGLYKYMWRPRDHSVDTSPVTTVGKNVLSDLKKAVCMKLGSVSILVPATERPSLLAQVRIAEDPRSPTILLCDDDTDKQLDSIIIFDNAGHSFELTDTNGDAIWDRYMYSTAQDEGAPFYSDMNMDGIPDFRGVMETRSRSIGIGMSWYNLIHEDDNYYDDIQGEKTEVVSTGGVWVLKERQ